MNIAAVYADKIISDMKECCKTGDEPKPSQAKKVTKWILWTLVVGIIVSLIFIQFLTN